ncbi:MAG TPA: RNA polymerase sigma factor [Terriglobales bacterium]|nr:RNA polymerase sigma factor [Terriglobales bacterium]
MAAACDSITTTQASMMLEQLFWNHHKRVLRAAYRITGNMADAEDVVQSVFIRLASAGQDQIENAESYLYRAAINGALDVIRRRKGEMELESASELASVSPHFSPERQLNRQELQSWLRKALAGLSPVAAEMFVLRFIEEKDNGEIARIVGTSRAVVAVRLHQVRAKLKKDFQRFMRGER